MQLDQLIVLREVPFTTFPGSVAAGQVIPRLLLKPTHRKSETLDELRFGPPPRRAPGVRSEFLKAVSVCRHAPGPCPERRERRGLGGPATDPPAQRILHSGETLTGVRDFITSFFGECMGRTFTSIAASRIGPLLFMVLWRCAYEMTAAREAARWTGPVFPYKPDFTGAVGALDRARNKPPLGLRWDTIPPPSARGFQADSS